METPPFRVHFGGRQPANDCSMSKSHCTGTLFTSKEWHCQPEEGQDLLPAYPKQLCATALTAISATRSMHAISPAYMRQYIQARESAQALCESRDRRRG